MHASGINVTQEMAQAFHKDAADEEILFCKFSIDLKNDAFVKEASGKKTGGDREAEFKAVAAVLEPKTPCYIFMRGENPKLFICVFYVPDNSAVKAKMLVASSNAALKQGLSVSIEADFAIGSPEECTYSEYQKVFASTNEDNVLTWAEKDAKQTLYETHCGFEEVKVQAIMGIPIPAADNVEPNLKGLVNKEFNTVELILDATTEVLGSVAYDITIADLVATKLPEKEPRYFMTNYKLTHEGVEEEKYVFIYYCPASCIPRQKMFYSSSKATILKLFNQLGVTDLVNLEADCPAEVSDAIIVNEIHPPKAKDTSFSKPKVGGRKAASRRGPKFQA